ncbi:MAG: hypothetical protein JO111_19085 [Caulobacteraceae bacterium]|nr:hypothetical protein [Caulobacteraceae bacterium]
MITPAADDPPAGWIVCEGLLQPDPTVAGYRARLQAVRGTCGQRDCRRRCEVDLDRLVARGLGALPVSAVQRLLKCNNLAGCGLEFPEDRRCGLPLRALFGRSHVRIRVKCAGCGFFRAATPEALWRRVAAGEASDEGLLVSDVPGRIKGPCRQCGKKVWRVDILWPERARRAASP